MNHYHAVLDSRNLDYTSQPLVINRASLGESLPCRPHKFCRATQKFWSRRDIRPSSGRGPCFNLGRANEELAVLLLLVLGWFQKSVTLTLAWLNSFGCYCDYCSGSSSDLTQVIYPTLSTDLHKSFIVGVTSEPPWGAVLVFNLGRANDELAVLPN